VLEDLPSGSRANLDDERVRDCIWDVAAARFRVVSGDFQDAMETARAQGAREVFAASSASYGDDAAIVRLASRAGRPLSRDTANEAYAAVFRRAQAPEIVGLELLRPVRCASGPARHVRGGDPGMAAGAVGLPGVPRERRQPCHPRLLPRGYGCRPDPVACDDACPRGAGVRGVTVGTTARTTLFTLHATVLAALSPVRPGPAEWHGDAPEFSPAFRADEASHSCADVGHARRVQGYEPVVSLLEGVLWPLPWFAAGGAGVG